VPTITDNAVVIRRWDFSETSQTVSLFTREHGIIRGLAKGSKRAKASFSGGLDLLNEGEIVAIVKPGRDLATLTAWHLRLPHRVLHENLHANRLALYMADLIHHMLIDHDPHAGVFDALSAALALIDDDASRAEIALLRLQWVVLSEAGYRPELQRDARSGEALSDERATMFFSSHAGGVVQVVAQTEASDGLSERPGVWRVRAETIALLRDLADSRNISSAMPETLRRANRLLAAHAREIIGSEPHAMRWAFPDLASQTKG
jgi:DNA repair protein RecO (recombination protein O)